MSEFFILKEDGQITLARADLVCDETTGAKLAFTSGAELVDGVWRPMPVADIVFKASPASHLQCMLLLKMKNLTEDILSQPIVPWEQKPAK